MFTLLSFDNCSVRTSVSITQPAAGLTSAVVGGAAFNNSPLCDYSIAVGQSLSQLYHRLQVRSVHRGQSGFEYSLFRRYLGLGITNFL